MKHSKWNFIQCYYVSLSLVKTLNSLTEENMNRVKQSLPREFLSLYNSVFNELFNMCLEDFKSSRQLISHYYKESNPSLNLLVSKFKSHNDFLTKWTYMIEHLKYSTNLVSRGTFSYE